MYKLWSIGQSFFFSTSFHQTCDLQDQDKYLTSIATISREQLTSDLILY
jgi:hypothetical protein